jgi:hypothetical protein
MCRKFFQPTLVLVAAGALMLSGAALAQQQGTALPPGQVPAVLKARETEFVYRSSARLFTCEELRNHVAVILRAVGARQDVQVRANECESYIDPNDTMGEYGTVDRRSRIDPTRSESALDRMRPSRTQRGSQSTPVRIQVMMPVELTPDILEEVDRDKARRELVSRVTGNQNAELDDAIFFAAERRPITLSHDTIKLNAIDCELLEQMAMTVFRKLDLKVTSQSLSCDPRERSRLLPQMTVEALLPVGFQLPGEEKTEQKK